MTIAEIVLGYKNNAVLTCEIFAGLYIVYIAAAFGAYFKNVYKGSWDLEESMIKLCFGLPKALCFGFILFLAAGLCGTLLWPIAWIAPVIMIIHPEFREQMGEQFTVMHKRKVLKYIVFSIPVLVLMVWNGLMDVAEHIMNED